MPYQLYKHYSEDGKLLYVGISDSATGRLISHRENKAKWLSKVARIDIETFNNEQEARKEERRIIREKHPLYNYPNSLSLNKSSTLPGLRDIASALRWIERERIRRNRQVRELRNKGWTYARIADKVGLTRQRVAQILEAK